MQWISPYFYISFTEYCKTCLENSDEDGLRTMLRNPLLLTEYDRERAWIQIGQALEKNIQLLEHYEQKARKKGVAPKIFNVSLSLSSGYIRTILKLPKAPFTRLRDQYAYIVMQLSIQLFNKRYFKRDIAESWLNDAATLAASESMYKQVVYKVHEIKRIREKSISPIGIRVAIGVTIVLLRMITAQGACNTIHVSTSVYTLNNHKETTTVCATYPPPGSSTATSLQPPIAKP